MRLFSRAAHRHRYVAKALVIRSSSKAKVQKSSSGSRSKGSITCEPLHPEIVEVVQIN